MTSLLSLFLPLSVSALLTINPPSFPYLIQVAFLKKDYESLKARYYNDTQEVATTGRSNVFIEIMSVVDDFERARMAYKPSGDEEKVRGLD